MSKPQHSAQSLPDARTLAGLVTRREISAREAVSASLARIAALDGTLAAFCTLAPEAALKDADRIDAALARGEAVGPLAGVPVAVKDLICTAGLRTTFGSPLYDDFVPDEDDISVSRLRRSGAIVIGKTNTSEFGYGPVGHNSLFETTRNPWNPELTPGGSSAGSAAAVAAGLVPLALGSDGGGSIRIPAALTGIFGLKASWGRVPLWPGCRDERHPGASGWEALEHIGPMTRTVADAALALSVMTGPTPMDRHSLPAEPLEWLSLDLEGRDGIRLAYVDEVGPVVDVEVAALCRDAARELARLFRAKLVYAAPETGATQPVFEVIVAMETDREGLRAMATRAGHQFSRSLAEVLKSEWTADAFTQAILGRKRIANATARFMEDHHLFLTPTVATFAFPAGAEGPTAINGQEVSANQWTCFSALANLTGCPAASVPVGFTRAGLPVGLQIMGGHLADMAVLRAASALEREMPWADHWPSMTGMSSAH